ncbi:unnamed protein product, partial [Arabidopsis halleri]
MPTRNNNNGDDGEHPNKWAELRQTLLVMRENFQASIHNSILNLGETVVQNRFQQLHESNDCDQANDFIGDPVFDVYDEEDVVTTYCGDFANAKDDNDNAFANKISDLNFFVSDDEDSICGEGVVEKQVQSAPLKQFQVIHKINPKKEDSNKDWEKQQMNCFSWKEDYHRPYIDEPPYSARNDWSICQSKEVIYKEIDGSLVFPIEEYSCYNDDDVKEKELREAKAME